MFFYTDPIRFVSIKPLMRKITTHMAGWKATQIAFWYEAIIVHFLTKVNGTRMIWLFQLSYDIEKKLQVLAKVSNFLIKFKLGLFLKDHAGIFKFKMMLFQKKFLKNDICALLFIPFMAQWMRRRLCPIFFSQRKKTLFQLINISATISSSSFLQFSAGKRKRERET